MTIAWTAEKESRLRSLVLAGEGSYSEMARTLELPRSAVLGKLKRLRDRGVQWVPPKREAPRERSVTPAQPRRRHGLGPRDAGIVKRIQSKRLAQMVDGLPLFEWRLKESTPRVASTPRRAELPEPTSLRVPFIERTTMQCAWIDDAIDTPPPPKKPKRKAKRKVRAMPLFAGIIDEIAESKTPAKESTVVEPVEPDPVVITFGVTCCGHPTVGRSSYCAHHTGIVYVSDSKRGH